MSSDSIKKRRIADEGSNNGDIGVGSDGSSTAAIITEMKELMLCMQNKIDGMQNEMNGMKSRLSRMDELAKKCEQQEEKCNILEEKCDYFERGMKILIKENKWEYSVPHIPNRHWRDLGFGDDYIENMESLLLAIKIKCCILRKGEGNSDSTVHLESPSSTLLRYDDALLPHWKEFTTALQLNRNNNIEFTIQNVQLTPSVIDLLIPVLKGKLIKLCLSGNKFTSIRQGIKLVVKCMEYNHQMREFYLSNNPLEGVENAQLVLDAIIGHPSITIISLENCLRGGGINGYSMLCSLLASGKSFEYIDLDNNGIETGLLDLEGKNISGNNISGNTAIPDYIASNPPLKKLFLSGNKLDDDDAIWIARALRQNTNLEHLYLHNNDFTDIGCQALSKATYDSTSLNSVFDCNHTCQIDIDGDGVGSGGGTSMPAGVSNPKTTRSMKIEYVIYLRHKEWSNVQHLNSEFDDHDVDGALTLKFVPKVLEAVYNYSNESLLVGRYAPPLSFIDIAPPLSIMYEILRGWKMPELYGNR